MAQEITVLNNQKILEKDFKIYGSIENPLFLAKDVAEWIGYEVSNVSKMVKNVDEDEKIITRINNTSATFLTEYGLYEVLMQSRKPIAKAFKKEVKNILKQLRQTGVVITEKATEEAIDFEKKYGTYRIRKTFTNSNNLRADYEEFKDLSKAEWKAKRLSGQDRIKLHNIIFDAISKRLQNNITELKGSEMLAMQELLTDIKSDTLKLCNNVNGGIKRGQTQEIGKLKAELESLKPTPLEDMVCINYHAFSYDNSAIDKDGHWKPAYRTWIQNFPMEDIPSINYWLDRGVDFNKPVKIIIKCINKKEFDTTNLVKAIQDVLFNKERGKYRADDNFIRAGEIETIGFCDDYSDGKMYIDLENIDNCNIIDTNMDANMNEQLHNQEFAEFVSNLFGDF